MRKRMWYGKKMIGGAMLSLILAGVVSMMGGTVAFANYDPKEADEAEPVQVVTEETPEAKPFSVAGNGEVLDDISDDETKQFITVRTKNNQTFFVVIDRANSVDNVYMLSMIDENDLAEFLEDGEEDEAVLPTVQLPQDNAVAVDENGNPIPSGDDMNAENEKKSAVRRGCC